MNGHTNNRLARLSLGSLHDKATKRLAQARQEQLSGATDVQDELDYWQGYIHALEEADILIGLDTFKV